MGEGRRLDTGTALLEGPVQDGPWSAVVWNDPVNLMSYVVHVLRTLFGYSRPTAHRLMLQVHEEGRATVSRGSREEMESDVQRLHAWGLRATIERIEEDA
ncbi:ATP-dependent Clp protease adapter ClpS [Brachybacterium nesterenkovii]|uniref:ATP-dependent Clp protease adapter ClpS n=1 Tax=Brachybacterium nesterenkovii TaxID=47847 RepID=UPI003D27F7CF